MTTLAENTVRPSQVDREVFGVIEANCLDLTSMENLPSEFGSSRHLNREKVIGHAGVFCGRDWDYVRGPSLLKKSRDGFGGSRIADCREVIMKVKSLQTAWPLCVEECLLQRSKSRCRGTPRLCDREFVCTNRVDLALGSDRARER